jgi:NCS1 family nucleobase:cation symporter-1
MSELASRELDAYEGTRPQRSGDVSRLETWGMSPIPVEGRYGKAWRMGPVWFTPNMEVSAVFLGTLGALFGLGFGTGALALAIGIVVGTIPVAIMATWGQQTGTGQVPLARMPFGKSIVLPGVIQWLSAIGWIAIGCFFGAQAAHLLFHIPFWLAALIVLVLEAAISIVGYELAVQAQKWGAVIMTAFFLLLTVRIFQHHLVLPKNTVHGAALAAAFVLMIAVAISGTFSWASYASDYSRYLPEQTSKTRVFWYTLGGMVISYSWLAIIGLAAASVLGNQTAGGISALMGGRALGDLALAAIVFAAIVASSMNDYSGSLAFQALGARVKRPIVSAVVAVAAFATILWMNAGSTSTRFENILLFTGYWLAPFTAIVMIDWHYHRREYTPQFLPRALEWHNLRAGWAALVAFAVGFGAMVPFMDTSIIVGPVSRAMDGADLAYPVGFLVTGALYFGLRRARAGGERQVGDAAAAAPPAAVIAD